MKRINLRIDEELYEHILVESKARDKTFNEFMNECLKEIFMDNVYQSLEERVDIKIKRIVDSVDRLSDLSINMSNGMQIQNAILNEVLNIERIDDDE